LIFIKTKPSLLAIILVSLIYFSFQNSHKAVKPITPPPEVGEKIPELRICGRDGKFITLSSLKGKLVLIDFWASWNAPSRMENQNIVLMYNKYKTSKFKNGNGFEVYSISLDNQREKWIESIRKDNLYWPNHVSELLYWNDKTTKIFGIKILPANLLIDGEGTILARNITGWVSDSINNPTNFSKLESELKKYLNQ
jgi:thiol-disulfide isomerase/thioredoxin